MVATISRDELKKKIDDQEDFKLVETLPSTAYHHAHLPGAINLPPDRVSPRSRAGLHAAACFTGSLIALAIAARRATSVK